MIDIHDPRSNQIAEVLSNKTAKRVLALLSEKELSQTELAQQLKLPASTVDYTIKKIVSAGLIEPSRSLWSSKGKRVPVYRVSEKRILISPKKLMKGVVPSILVSFAAAALIKLVFVGQQSVNAPSATMEKASDAFVASGSSAYDLYGPLATVSNMWVWFLLGSLTALTVFLLWNWGKK